MKKLIFAVLISVAAIFWSISQPNPKEVETLFQNKVAAVPALPGATSVTKATAAPLPTAAKSPSTPTPLNVNSVPAPVQPYNPGQEKRDQLELQHFKELNKPYVEQNLKKMKSDEIESLKKSIVEDQETLKKLESSGTDIDSYKFVERNLEIRKSRLKKLLR